MSPVLGAAQGFLFVSFYYLSGRQDAYYVLPNPLDMPKRPLTFLYPSLQHGKPSHTAHTQAVYSVP